MLEHLEHLILEAARHPRRPRAPLYKEILRSPVFLIYVDEPLPGAQDTMVSRPMNSFDIWADRDQDLGGVWVPLFPSPEVLARYVKGRSLPPPPGKEFLWMEQGPGKVFGLFDGIPCFAGLKFWLDESVSVSISRVEVGALAEGRLPAEAPTLYEPPVQPLRLPPEARAHLTSLTVGSESHQVLWVAEAGSIEVEDLRKLARVRIDGGEPALVPCRHLIMILKRFRDGPEEERNEELLRCLVSFEMQGEAQALRDWLSRNGLNMGKFLPASSPGNFPRP